MPVSCQEFFLAVSMSSAAVLYVGLKGDGQDGKLYPEDPRGVRPILASSTDDVTCELNEGIEKKCSARFAEGTTKQIRGTGIGLAYLDDDSIQPPVSEFGDGSMSGPRHCGNAEREGLAKTEYNKDFDVIAKMNHRKNDKLLTCPPHITQRSDTVTHRTSKCSNTCVGEHNGLVSSTVTVSDRLIKKINIFLLNPQTNFFMILKPKELESEQPLDLG